VTWIHDVSQSVLAGAVLALSLVIMLELRSIVRLRRVVDGHLARVFEQLDLLRYENQQLLEAQPPVRRPPAAPSPATKYEPTAASKTAATTRAVTRGQIASDRAMPHPEVTAPAPAATTGEVRLLASLAAARARRELPQRPSTLS
jgi:hypothetical protein